MFKPNGATCYRIIFELLERELVEKIDHFGTAFFEILIGPTVSLNICSYLVPIRMV